MYIYIYTYIGCLGPNDNKQHGRDGNWASVRVYATCTVGHLFKQNRGLAQLLPWFYEDCLGGGACNSQIRGA